MIFRKLFDPRKEEKDLTVDVMSRLHMEHIMGQLPKNSCVVSINTPGEPHLPIPVPVLYLDFPDTEDHAGMSATDADKVVCFIAKNVNCGNCNIYVHCDQGISRSAGVAAAILRAYGKKEDKILDCSDYCINSRCYEMMLKAFHIPVTAEEVADAKHKSKIAYMQSWPKF